MGDYIERESAIEAVTVWYKKTCRPENMSSYNMGERAAYTTAICEITEIPAADVRTVVLAQILDMRYVEEDGEWKCSRCGWQYTLCVCGKDVTSKIHFCPNCGADMREES